MTADRERLLEQLAIDLMGPQLGPEEVITAWPSDQYISGILYPPSLEPQAEDDDATDVSEADDGSPGSAVPPGMTRRPSVMGVSFALEGDAPSIIIRAKAATYVPKVNAEDPERADSWTRRAAHLDPVGAVPVHQGLHRYAAGVYGRWWIRGLRHDGRWQVTVALENTGKHEPGRIRSEEAHLFQVAFEIEAVAGARIVPRYSRKADTADPDTRIHNLIYRGALEYAVGHTCGATWAHRDGRCVVSTTWVPRYTVPAMSADGHALFREEAAARASEHGDCFRAEALAQAPDAPALAHLLEGLPAAYERWRQGVSARVDAGLADGSLTPDMAGTARENLAVAADVTRRIRAGIGAVTDPADPAARRAFQLAQRAMVTQRRWAKGQGESLTWRPFQLAFQLLALGGIAAPRRASGEVDPDRDVMDLLWFPTGGGKTEAYLALTAFTLILRRLRHADADEGAGVTVLMRYTLRLLTVQQFERAARLVLACEHLRREAAKGGDLSLGKVPFSIGLWVGSAATPNKVEDARNDDDENKKAKQLARCPACDGKGLRWDRDKKSPHFLVECPSPKCPLHGEALPVYTVDEDVYAKRPGLVIGTIDKFAQVVRKRETHSLFDGAGGPPELIIQDELHLISGPLGTVAGLYEAAIDLLCTRDGLRPKVVGSTATIRRASEQVRQLFDREVLQFPPPVLDADDSCFAVVDRGAPGRLYAGVTTAGRSPKFVLQATCASLLQGASEDAVVSPAARDWYWTLVAYFNSLRELGGALVMMQDDVLDSMKNLASLHGTTERAVDDIMELTSRVPQAEIPGSLVALEKRYDPAKPPSAQAQHTGIVLATNMISVGVDIPRLGLMAVNGQPKTMSEYIQATSRVGRDRVPGLVVTVYNVGRPRDRSHYEAFLTWHQTLYRDVEATSVTPFAPRARDRALHAALVALARHAVPGMLEDTALTPARRAALDALVDEVLARVERLDPSEQAEVAAEARRYLDEWEARGAVAHYWRDREPNDSLLVSAEVVAEAKAVQGRWLPPARPTPNSMRDVEAQVRFRLTEKLT